MIERRSKRDKCSTRHFLGQRHWILLQTFIMGYAQSFLCHMCANILVCLLVNVDFPGFGGLV